MPGFAFLGKFALGQVGPPSIIVPGVTATGVAGVISASTGAVPGVSAKGSAGNLIPSTLSINPHRLLPTWSDARASSARYQLDFDGTWSVVANVKQQGDDQNGGTL